MDTHLRQTPFYYRQFALSQGKENPYIFSNNMDTQSIGTLSMAPLVSLLIRCTQWLFFVEYLFGEAKIA